MEQDIPDYDMDSEDEKWVHSQAKKMDLLPLKVFFVFKNYCFALMINFLSAVWYIVVINQVYCRQKVIFQSYSVLSH